MTPWLSDEEIADMCRPLEQPAAQSRFLKREGYVVSRRPNGRPFLMRAEVERVKVGRSFQGRSRTVPASQIGSGC